MWASLKREWRISMRKEIQKNWGTFCKSLWVPHLAYLLALQLGSSFPSERLPGRGKEWNWRQKWGGRGRAYGGFQEVEIGKGEMRPLCGSPACNLQDSSRSKIATIFITINIYLPEVYSLHYIIYQTCFSQFGILNKVFLSKDWSMCNLTQCDS